MENLMSMFNPEMMQNLMGNEEIQKMMKDPNIMNNLQNMMGNNDIFKGLNGEGDPSTCCPEGEGSCDPSACCPEGDGSCDPSTCCPEGDGSCDPSTCCPEGDGRCDPSACCPEECSDIKIDDLENIEIEENRLNIGDKVITKNLNTEDYNNKKGVIEDRLQNGRYVVLFEDESIAAIKELNLVNRFENIENID
jgi:hypothetical protein